MSVMWDNLTALQPATVKEAQTVLFLRKLPRHIRNLIKGEGLKNNGIGSCFLCHMHPS